jgi:hypothetical protein
VGGSLRGPGLYKGHVHTVPPSKTVLAYPLGVAASAGWASLEAVGSQTSGERFRQLADIRGP